MMELFLDKTGKWKQIDSEVCFFFFIFFVLHFGVESIYIIYTYREREGVGLEVDNREILSTKET